MAKKKKAQGEQKWLIVGALVLLLGGWWIFKSMQQGAKIALIDENGGGESNGTVYAMKGVWAYGKKSVKPDVTPAFKSWVSTLAVREGDASGLVTVEKKKAWCNSVKFSDPKEYSGKFPYTFGVTARISPKGMAVTETSQLAEVAKRKLTVSFLNDKGKVMGTGTADLPVLAVVSNAGTTMMDEGSGGSGGNTTSSTNQSKLTGMTKPAGTDLYQVAVVPAKEFIDKDALKIFKMQFCLDKSNTDAVDVELTDMAWLLDTKYIGPAEQVDRAVIVY